MIHHRIKWTSNDGDFGKVEQVIQERNRERGRNQSLLGVRRRHVVVILPRYCSISAFDQVTAVVPQQLFEL